MPRYFSSFWFSFVSCYATIILHFKFSVATLSRVRIPSNGNAKMCAQKSKLTFLQKQRERERHTQNTTYTAHNRNCRCHSLFDFYSYDYCTTYTATQAHTHTRTHSLAHRHGDSSSFASTTAISQ